MADRTKSDRGPQYLADLEVLAGTPEADYLQRSDDDESPLGAHYDRLFDQNENEAGELIDPATGLSYQNDDFPETEDLTILTDEELFQEIPSWGKLLKALVEEGLIEPEELNESHLYAIIEQEDEDSQEAWLAAREWRPTAATD